jgi:hypothetical protein
VNWIFIGLFFALLIAFFVWSMRFERDVVAELNAEADAELALAQAVEVTETDESPSAESEAEEQID